MTGTELATVLEAVADAVLAVDVPTLRLSTSQRTSLANLVRRDVARRLVTSNAVPNSAHADA